MGAYENQFVVKIESDSDNNYFISCYPNPFSTETFFKLDNYYDINTTINICNINGEQIESLSVSNNDKIVWRPINIDYGIYFYTIRINNQFYSGKLIYIP